MFKDTEEELKRLEAELLEDDEEPEQCEDGLDDVLNDEFLQRILAEDEDIDATRIYREPNNTWDGPAYNTDYVDDYVDEDPYEMSMELEENRDSITGLLVTASFLSAGILLVLLWWAIRYGGMLG